MAERRAKLAIDKKSGKKEMLCPVTGKSMTPVRLIRKNGQSGMFWVVLEDFDGSDKALSRAIPVR